ncbi:hypothetical protein B0H11DRAFT_1971599 [Mycena galericulata]|nr:hypothetical protein B0H11DRAFT_1971599 [Mycena galericulata]
MSTTDLRRQLIALNAAIAAQRSALSQLETDRNAVERQLRDTATFPVLTLPVEITAEIFSLCLPEFPRPRNEPRGSRLLADRFISEAPTVFLGVCRAWRDIALQTPALWATLEFGYDYFPWPHPKPTLEGVRAWMERWLDRAAHRPLSIQFHSDALGSETHRVLSPSCMHNVIHRYAARIVYLELNFSQREIAGFSLDSISFPLLQRAVLRDVYPWPSSEPVPVFTNAPRLHDLLLFRQGSSWRFPSLQLTKFEGEITENFELFTVAMNLTEVICYAEYDPPHTTPVISHARLLSLTLFPPDYASAILDHLTLPALQSLHFTISEEDELVDPASVLSFFQRSAAPLRTLSGLNVCEQTYDEWAECFSCVGDTLDNLEVHYPSQRFLSDSLTDNFSPLKALRTLSFLNSPDVNRLLLGAFLNSSPGIQSFRLVCLPFLDNRVQFSGTRDDYFADVAYQGMDIYIRPESSSNAGDEIRLRNSVQMHKSYTSPAPFP